MAAVTLNTAAFALGLAVTLAASELLARGLTRLGAKAGLSDGVIGLLSALGADSPELSSAVVAILAGAHEVGVGVVLGSNLFNLAALLGLTALIARGIRIRRDALLLDSIAGLATLLLAGLLISGRIGPLGACVAIALVFGAYVVLLSGQPWWRLPLVRFLRRGAPRGLVEVAYEATHDRPAAKHGSWLPVLLLPAALAGVVTDSFVMVHAALAVSVFWHLSAAVVGTLVLAAVTSLPNLWVALHFARADRGTALFSAAMNSNTINLVGGLAVPALILGFARTLSAAGDFEWLVGLTLLAVLAPSVRGRLGPLAGALLISVYVVFCAFILFGA